MTQLEGLRSFAADILGEGPSRDYSPANVMKAALAFTGRELTGMQLVFVLSFIAEPYTKGGLPLSVETDDLLDAIEVTAQPSSRPAVRPKARVTHKLSIAASRVA